ncbi:unnamed protein product [Prorocentrum cordatum]|uniref:Ig-like domain-containing protein n=1 Tax=Prorocentrum cordatum TaxID=2364126 RepID=A0ABN9XMH9_9DINO|nr:unnamed protein product [Polarella glacialis]
MEQHGFSRAPSGIAPSRRHDDATWPKFAQLPCNMAPRGPNKAPSPIAIGEQRAGRLVSSKLCSRFKVSQGLPDPREHRSYVMAAVVILASIVAGLAWCGEAADCANDGSDYSYAESVSGSTRTVVTNHCPNHPFYDLNPNTAVKSSTTYEIPAIPTFVGAATDSSTSSGHIDLSETGAQVGVFFNAAMLFTPYGGPNYGIVLGWTTSATYAEGNSFDSCGCHGSSTTEASYHCHVPPSCLLNQLGQTSSEHSPQIGWAFDGFPLYGPRGPSGIMMQTCTETGGTYGTDVCTDDCGGYPC